MRIIAEDLVGLAEALEAGALTSAALVERALRRYAETEPQIHAFAWLDAARAQHFATVSDERRRTRGAVGPLEGIPIGVKDIFDTAGIPTENGSALFAGRVPEATLPGGAIGRGGGRDRARKDRQRGARLPDAGAHAQSVGPVAHAGRLVDGIRRGRRRGRRPGGDRLADERLGHPPRGVLRRRRLQADRGSHPDRRRVRVLAHARSRRRVREKRARRRPVRGDPRRRDGARAARGPRPDAAFRRAAHQRVGARVGRDARALPGRRRCAGPRRRTGGVAEAACGSRRRAAHPAHGDAVRGRSGGAPEGRATTRDRERVRARAARRRRAHRLPRVREALAARDRLVASFLDWASEYDAILTPPAVGEAPTPDTTGDPRFCSRWSLVGAPAITIPTGLGPNRLPLGLQLVGAPGDDERLLAAAAWAEAMLPSIGAPPL